MKKHIAYLLIFFMPFSSYTQKRKKETETINTQNEVKNYTGFFDFTYNELEDRISLYVDKLNEEFLYMGALSSGVGSNDIGLDRGQLGTERVVKFVKAGQKLLLVQPNYKYRAISDNPDEIKSVEEAFAQSIIWGFPILSQTNNGFEIDLTHFLIRDSHNISSTLEATNQGIYGLDESRCALDLSATKNFPLNSEFEVTLTYAGKPTGQEIRSVAPDAHSITVNVHHSFVQLPDAGYQPRVFDPRAGYFQFSYLDYATPISEPIVKRFISKHRLMKKEPEAEMSEATEPIIYYMDRGAPEPIRSALMEGAGWWNEAFEGAGFKNAFQVKLLPEGVDPLDIRYNVIQWVHRSARGWSYGSSVRDPRTGEIIKGHVTLGSLRVRQDFLIAEGLLAPYKDKNEISDKMQEMSLARLKQLAAHEIGHTLGLAHSYTSSSEDIASVMDYPHPYAELKNGQIFLDNAYDHGIGLWDKVAVNYGYRQYKNENEEMVGLNEIIQNGLKNGLTFISDQDARLKGGAHPYAHLWDNGKSAADELNRVMKIRTVALDNFGENNIKLNTPFANLEEVLVPIYFFHRYQVEAATKMIGGLNYRYALRGDGQPITEFISKNDQMKSLEALTNTIKAEALVLPEKILRIIPPRPIGYSRNNELIDLRTAPSFDMIGAAEAAISFTIELLLHPSRMNRLIEFKNRKSDQPGLSIVIEKLIGATWMSEHQSGIQSEIQRSANSILLENLFNLINNEHSSTQTKALIQLKVNSLKVSINKWLRTESDEAWKAHYTFALKQIVQFEKNPSSFNKEHKLSIPAGSPIGEDLSCSFEEF